MSYSNFEIIDEMEKSKETGQITKELCDIFVWIANRCINTKQFNYLSYPEDLKQEIIKFLIISYPKFKPIKSTEACEYLMTVARSACIGVICKEQRDTLSGMYSGIKDET